MKMEMKMTEKDKKLLVFLGIFVVVVCFSYWGIRPAIKSIISTNEDIQDAQDTKDMYDMKLVELPMLQFENEDMEEEIVNVRETYFSMMTSDEIDKYFTNMALSYSLYAYDLGIVMPDETSDLTPYQYSDKALYGSSTTEEADSGSSSSSSEDLLDEDGDSDDTDSEDTGLVWDDEVVVDTGIYAAKVTLKLGGDMDKLAKFVDDLSNTDQKIRVCNYSYSTTKTSTLNEDGAYVVNTDNILDITVEIYMCQEDVTESEVAEETTEYILGNP
jgi:hypothetical protein